MLQSSDYTRNTIGDIEFDISNTPGTLEATFVTQFFE